MAEDQSLLASRLSLVSQQWTRDAHLGMQNLLLHGMRSLLTMLGMIIGVGAVIATVSLGDGAKSQGKDKNRCHYR